MTNEEKYKTTEEREKAFHEFCCKKHDCSVCEARYEATAKCFGRDHCVLRWLDMEVEEEKPLACPFCGGEAEVAVPNPIGTKGVYVRCKECRALSMPCNTKAEAIATWNRRVK